MRLLSAVCAAALLAVAPLRADSWTLTLDTVERSILRLRGESHTEKWLCSAVVVGPGIALTAAHCVDEKDANLALGERDAAVAKSNRILDLAVLKFTPKNEYALPMALTGPKRGTEVAIVGYALGLPDLHSQYGHVSNTNDSQDHMLVLDLDIFHGDSGTAIVDRQGRLVGLAVSRTDDDSALMGNAVRIEVIRDFLEGVK